MSAIVRVLLAGVVLTGAVYGATAPAPVSATATCYRCGRAITNPKLVWERDYLAFLSAEAARRAAWQRASHVIDWPTILRRAAAKITN